MNDLYVLGVITFLAIFVLVLAIVETENEIRELRDRIHKLEENIRIIQYDKDRKEDNE